jgi:hypothetical protein
VRSLEVASEDHLLHIVDEGGGNRGVFLSVANRPIQSSTNQVA